MDATALSRSRASGCYRVPGAVVISLLVGAQAEVNNVVTDCEENVSGAKSLRVPSCCGVVLVLAGGEIEESDVVLESALLLQLVE